VVIAEFTLGHALLTVLSIFFFVIWIWILITILSDLFRDHELSGWWKAVWVLFLVFIPFLTALIYLIARGNGMRERTIKAQAEAKQHFDDYVRQTGTASGGASTADELSKLADLKAKGTICEEEFQAQKAKLLG
jgi:ABC-type transport system involved in cytochrome bd biosynthesis fused ATPase/permease subunit